MAWFASAPFVVILGGSGVVASMLGSLVGLYLDGQHLRVKRLSAFGLTTGGALLQFAALLSATAIVRFAAGSDEQLLSITLGIVATVAVILVVLSLIGGVGAHVAGGG